MNSSAPESAEEAAGVRLALARHQRRREQGVPTLSVLVGSQEEAVQAWQNWVASMGWTPARVIHAPAENAPEFSPPEGPIIYLLPPGGAGTQRRADFISSICRFLTAQGKDQASAFIAVALERADADAYLQAEPYSRARAIFAEGIVDLPAVLKTTTDGSAERTLAVLTHRGVRPETVDAFKAAAAARQQTASPEAGDETADRARSAAERFLFELLGDLPDTAGLFALNVRLGFCFGPMPAEVDLLAASLWLAVEIDGFHHFREPECYRRDRRKDAVLQKQGYLVLRFLAEDVVVRLEEIVEEIRAAVAFRRAAS